MIPLRRPRSNGASPTLGARANDNDEPPSLESLEKRLKRRGTETPEQLAIRLRNAEIEMAAAPEYDYVVVNADGKIDDTVEQIAEIIRKESTKPRHYDL